MCSMDTECLPKQVFMWVPPSMGDQNVDIGVLVEIILQDCVWSNIRELTLQIGRIQTS